MSNEQVTQDTAASKQQAAEEPVDAAKEFEMSDLSDEQKATPQSEAPVIGDRKRGEQMPIPTSHDEQEEDAEKKKEEESDEEKKGEDSEEEAPEDKRIYGLRTTANREDQVVDFVMSNATKKKLGVTSLIRPHGMRGYVFIEAQSRADAEQAAFNVPYARGILPAPITYKEIEHMLEQVKQVINIQKNDIAEIIAGPFKREQCKITRIDKAKEEVVVELLEAAVPIPITLKMDAIKVIRRESGAEA